MKKQTYVEIICAAFILLFLYTALSKLTNFNDFSDGLRRSPLLEKHHFFIAWALPVFELVVSALLLIPDWKLLGLRTSLILLIGFTVYLVYIVVFTSDNLPCSCGGVLAAMTWKQHIFFNLFFIVLALMGIRLYKKSTTGRQEQSA